MCAQTQQKKRRNDTTPHPVQKPVKKDARPTVRTAKKGRKTRSTRKKTARGRLLFNRWPLWAVLSGAVLLGVVYLAFFYHFVVDDSSFRWKAIYGDPVFPAGFDVHGIDISHYQEEIDWEQLRNASLDTAPVSFVFIKATEGMTLLDENFNLNFYEAKRNHLIRGAYHFFLPNVDAAQQARFFLKQVHLEPGDLPPVLDVEKAGNLSTEQLQRAVKKWLDIVEQAYGVKPIIYTGYKFKLQHLNTRTFDAYPYWIAHYYVKELAYKGTWSFWQHTDCGRVKGIKGNVDCNIFNGSMEELMRLVIPEPDGSMEATEAL